MTTEPGDREFQARILRLDGRADAGANAGSGEFERRLVGFCVAANLAQSGQSLAMFSRRLGVSKGHVSKMTVGASRAFVGLLDMNRSVVGGDDEHAQRLESRLSEFFDEIRPGERNSSSDSVLDWLARYSVRGTRADNVRNVLLRSEIALKRCELLDFGVANLDREVRDSLEDLARLASGPFGGALIAGRRCAELGLLVPRAFFDVMERHLFQSPVGFRLLRTLDRFMQLWHDPRAQHTNERFGEVRTRMGPLLERLAKEGGIDPYPGAEWGISLAQDCLRAGSDGLVARRWLTAIINDPGAAERARVAAAWVLLSFPEERTKEADKASILQALRAPSGATSGDDLSSKWADLFDDFDYLVDSTRRQRDRFEQVAETFHSEHEAVKIAVESVVDEDSQLAGLRSGLISLIFAALVTPDTRVRRMLVESVVAAELVPTVWRVLTALVDRANSRQSDRPEALSDGVRESALYFLSRIRQPEPCVVTAFRRAVIEGDDAAAQTSLWGIGDVWREDLWHRLNGGLGNPNSFDDVVETLVMAARGRRGAGNDTLDTTPRQRVAAAHALAAMASTVPPRDRRGRGDSESPDGLDEGTAEAHLERARFVLSRAFEDLRTLTAIDDASKHVKRLGGWGDALLRRPGIPDPVEAASM